MEFQISELSMICSFGSPTSEIAWMLNSSLTNTATLPSSEMLGRLHTLVKDTDVKSCGPAGGTTIHSGAGRKGSVFVYSMRSIPSTGG
jgi:hypothetical protein